MPPHHAAGGKNRMPPPPHSGPFAPANPLTGKTIPSKKAAVVPAPPRAAFETQPLLHPDFRDSFKPAKGPAADRARTVAAAEKLHHDAVLHNKAVFHRRQDTAVADALSRIAEAKAGIEPGTQLTGVHVSPGGTTFATGVDTPNPFGFKTPPPDKPAMIDFTSKRDGGARDLYQPDLTAKVALAQANLERRTHHGIVSPDTARREQLALTIIGHSTRPNFAESHQLPEHVAHGWPADHIVPEATTPQFAGGGGGAFGPPPAKPRGNPRQQLQDAQPGQSHDTLSRAFDLGENQSWGTAISKVGHAIDETAGTLAAAGNQSGLSIAEHPGAWWDSVRKRGLVGSEKAAALIGGKGMTIPDGVVIFASQLKKNAQGLLPSDTASEAAGTKNAPDRPIDPRNLGNSGFTDADHRRYVDMALARDWSHAEIDGLDGYDLLLRAYNNPPNPIERGLMNTGVEGAQMGGMLTGFYGLGHDALTGHAERSGNRLLTIGGDYLSGLKHPIRALETEPLNYIPGYGAAFKTVGALGHLRKFAGHTQALRDIETHLPASNAQLERALVTGEHTNPNLILNRGVYSRNVYTALGQYASDKFAGTFMGANKMLGGHLDSLVRRAVNENARPHTLAQQAYTHAARRVGKTRATALLGWQMTGGKPEDILAFYESIANDASLPKSQRGIARGQVAFLRDKVVGKVSEGTLSADDHAFLVAHEHISQLTSNTHIRLGQFDKAAQVYRAHELGIVAAAHAGDEEALNLLELRAKAHAGDVPDAMSDPAAIRRRIKTREAEKQGQRGQESVDRLTPHANEPRPVAPPHPREAHAPEIAAHDAEMATWQAAEPANLAPLKGGGFSTEAEATAAADAAKATHPKGATHEVSQRNDGSWTYEVTSPIERTGAVAKAELDAWKAREPKPGIGAKASAARKAWKDSKPKPSSRVEQANERAAARRAWQAAKPDRTAMDARHADEITAWRKAHKSEVDAWRRRTARAGGALREAEGTTRRADKRVETLTKAQQAAEDARPPLDYYALYEEALNNWHERHMADGGVVPARVAYTRAPSLTDTLNPFRTGGSGSRMGRLNKAAPKMPHSTGAMARSGNFLIDHRSPIRDSIHAQRMETGMGAYKLAIQHAGVYVPKGTVIPTDSVFVSADHFQRLGQSSRRLIDNPVQHSDYSQELSAREKRFADLKSLESRQHDVTDAPGYLVARGTWDRMMDYTRPESKALYDKFIRQYSRTLISLFPGTVIGNTLGTLPLVWAGGGGIRSHNYAARALGLPTRLGQRFMEGDRSIAPHSLYGGGVAGGLASDAHNIATKYMDFNRRLSVHGEDFGRVSAYFTVAGKHIRQVAKARKAAGDAREMRDIWDEYAREMASGRGLDDAIFEKALNHAEKFLGDTMKPAGAIGRQVGRVILFQSWVGHMAKLMLWTLPVEHPRRMVMLNIFAKYGDEWRKENGAWPDWMVNFLPLTHYSRAVPGGEQAFTGAINAMQLSPQSTAGGLMQNLLSDQPLQERIGGVVAPPWQQIATVATQGLKNRYAASPNDHANLWGTFENSVLGAIPGERKLDPQQGRKADNTLWDPSYKTYKDVNGRPLSPFLYPGAKPTRGVLGFLERSAGFGGYEVPNAGPITTAITDKANRNAREKPRKDAANARTQARLKVQLAALGRWKPPAKP